METVLHITIFAGLITCILTFAISFYVSGMRVNRKYYKINENKYKKYKKYEKILINTSRIFTSLFLITLIIVASK